MKNLAAAALLAALTALAANAATITWNASLARNGFDEADGTDLPVGSLVRVGTFNISDAAIAANGDNVAYLNSEFTEAAFTTIGSGVGDVAGHFSANTPGYTNAITLAGKQIYYWAFFSTDNTSETTSINTAAQIGIFYEPSGTNPSWAFPADASLGSTSISLSNLTDASTSMTELPEAMTILGAFGPGITQNNGITAFTLQNVPEPSVFILLVSGIIGLGGHHRLHRRA